MRSETAQDDQSCSHKAAMICVEGGDAVAAAL